MRLKALVILLFQSMVASALTSGEDLVLHIFQYSPEYTTQMREMASEYAKAFSGKRLEIEIVQDQYPKMLNAKISSGRSPDVFMVGSLTQIRAYQSGLADLSSLPLVSRLLPTALPNWTIDGKLYGYPIWFQSYGIIYNKKLFREAGITTFPKTLQELASLCEKLSARGLTPFGSAYKEWWVFKHIFERFVAVEPDPVALAARISSGQTGLQQLRYAGEFFDFMDLTMKYSQASTLSTDFNQQVDLFARGKVAMIHQGDWAEGPIVQANRSIEMGFFPLPVGTDLSLMADASVAWVLNNASPRLADCIEWLNWLSTNEYGRSFVSGRLGAQSTLKAAGPPAGQLVRDALPFIQKGKTHPWNERYWPDGFDEQFAKLIQKYLVKQMDRKTVLAEATRLWVQLAKPAK